MPTFSIHFSYTSKTLLTIGFKTRKFQLLKRTEALTVTNGLASCGGLLGLFMGISLLGVFEMFVYCVIRFAKKFTTLRALQQNPNKVFPFVH